MGVEEQERGSNVGFKEKNNQMCVDSGGVDVTIAGSVTSV